MSTADTVVNRVRTLAAPIVADLGLEIYDLEMVSGVLRLSIDTPTGGPAGVTLDNIALVSRLVSRELDHNDPMPGRYTLEVTSPGLERPLRTADHFRREVNKVVSVRLREAVDGRRRLQGTLLRADERGCVVVSKTLAPKSPSPMTALNAPRPCSCGVAKANPDLLPAVPRRLHYEPR